MAKPLVPWIGGKRKLADHLIPLFPEHTCYVEPFAGAGGIFFSKPQVECEVLNDINHDIFNLYRVVKHHFEELCKQFKWALTSRENWENLKSTPADVLTDIQRAARFLYLQKLAFGGLVDGQTFGTATTSRPRLNLLTLEQDLLEAHFRLSNAYIESLDWADIIKKYDRPHTLFYCDPPYWKVEGYGVPFDFDQYEKMLELAHSISGKMIISINDHPDVMELFKDLPSTSVEYTYTCGKSSSACTEMIFGNWPEVPAARGSQSALLL